MYNNLTVLTGKFRKIHSGHIHLLNEARSLNLPVVVLLNSDKGILNLGSKSIGETFTKRKEKLLNTGLVDKILWFYNDPTTWLKLLKPTNVIAGHDHTREEILSKGGAYAKNIIIINRILGLSSTLLLGEE